MRATRTKRPHRLPRQAMSIVDAPANGSTKRRWLRFVRWSDRLSNAAGSSANKSWKTAAAPTFRAQGARPDYWDVTYNFRVIEHRAQLSAPPGRTITANGNGEPRG